MISETKNEWYNKSVLEWGGTDAETTVNSRMIERFVEYLKKEDNIKIADLGGTKSSFKLLNRLFPKSNIFSINIDERQIKALPNPVFEDVLHTSFKPNYFDLAFGGDLIEHIIDTDQFILETKRILKHEGILILTTPNLASWYNRLSLLLGYSLPNYHPSKFRYGNPLAKGIGVYHKSVFTKRALAEFLESYDFKILECKGYSFNSNVAQHRIFRKYLNKLLLSSWRDNLCIMVRSDKKWKKIRE
jgi:SAM-dependent methyltransferase